MPPIACQLHDHYEHVCVFSLTVDILMVDGSRFKGIARDISVVDGQEYLVIQVDEQLQTLQLEKIKRLTYIGRDGMQISVP